RVGCDADQLARWRRAGAGRVRGRLAGGDHRPARLRCRLLHRRAHGAGRGRGRPRQRRGSGRAPRGGHRLLRLLRDAVGAAVVRGLRGARHTLRGAEDPRARGALHTVLRRSGSRDAPAGGRGRRAALPGAGAGAGPQPRERAPLSAAPGRMEDVMFDDQIPQHFPARRVLLAVSGSIAAGAATPYVTVMRCMLDLEVRAVLTRQAATMVAPRAVAAACRHPVLVDGEEGPSDGTVPPLGPARWADGMLGWPAT